MWIWSKKQEEKFHQIRLKENEMILSIKTTWIVILLHDLEPLDRIELEMSMIFIWNVIWSSRMKENIYTLKSFIIIVISFFFFWLQFHMVSSSHSIYWWSMSRREIVWSFNFFRVSRRSTMGFRLIIQLLTTCSLDSWIIDHLLSHSDV